mmetsp:Transcript_21000/g.62491  ORF Transcript_21000/g.62491 Transcript_21000/m.62491 type:complete len:181 (+) Transcript_21000:84-626(+)
MADADVDGGAVAGDYPVEVWYCAVCSLPHEYCSFGRTKAECRTRLHKENPALYAQIHGDGGGDAGAAPPEGDKKKQTRGGKAGKNLGGGKASKGGAKKGGVTISLATRNKRKFVTNVSGLKALGINLKKAAKVFSGRFAASSSVTDDDEIAVTGDHTDEIAEVILSKFPEVTEDMIAFKK